MFKKENIKYFALFILTILVYGFVLAFAIVKIDDWKFVKSHEYLAQAKNEQNQSSKLLYFEYSLFLFPSDEAYIGAGLAANSLSNVDLASKYLEYISGMSNWMKLADGFEIATSASPSNRVALLYNRLKTAGYPQLALKLLRQAAESGQVGRDGLIALANDAHATGNNQTAYDYLMRAKAIDPYYPQIYQQLTIVCEKLGKADETKTYQEFLDKITF